MKLKSDPISKENIKTYYEDHSDFAFEMKVYNLTKRYTYQSDHGGSYVDYITGKSRQYDIRCVLRNENGKYWLRMAVECKNVGDNFPLVISRIPRQNGEEILHMIQVGRNGDYFFKKSNEYNRWYKTGNQVGKEILQIGCDNKNELVGGNSEIWEKWSQAVNSSKDLIEKSMLREMDTEFDLYSIVLPIVVVPDNNLWVIDYNLEGEMIGEPLNVNECEYYTGSRLPVQRHGVPDDFEISHIHFFTAKGYEEFLKKFKELKVFWRDYYAE